jgi:hypothetical protein
MPLVRIDAIEGRSHDQIKNLLDAVHRAIVSAPSESRCGIAISFITSVPNLASLSKILKELRSCSLQDEFFDSFGKPFFVHSGSDVSG